MFLRTITKNIKTKKIKFIFLVITILYFLLSLNSYAQLTKDTTKFLGNIFSGNYVPGNFGKYWDQVTPENAGKWGNVASSQDTNSWNWSTLDFIYNYAVSHNYPFKFHNLVWGQTQPSWITSLNATQQAEYVEAWIRLAGKRYPKTALVDGVNEPLHSPPPYKNAIGGSGKTGWDWVIWAYRKARIYFPSSKLLLNENSILSDSNETKNFITIVDTLKSRGLIDGIGCQGHSLENVDTSIIRANLNRLASTGLSIYISEYDVGAANDSTQLEIYKKQFPLFWTYPDIKGITLWGYIEYQIWNINAYLLTFLLEERPAMIWLHQYLDSHQNVTLISTGERTKGIPNHSVLMQNYPNPFNPTTTIKYQVPNPGYVTLKVYDVLGREAATLVNENEKAGMYSFQLSALRYNLSSGIYFYRLTIHPDRINAVSFTEVKKLILLR